MSEAVRCIGADPPWQEHGGGRRGCQNHYGTMTKQEIREVMIEAKVAGQRPFMESGSCHLWMWATSGHLLDALWLMQVLGFRYVTSAAWVKMIDKPIGDVNHPSTKGLSAYTLAPDCATHFLQIGMGQYMRHAHELLLLGTRGPAMVPAPEDRTPSVIFAPRTEHSVKPQEAYDLIERASPGPRVEYFARKPRDGWSVWGDQAP